MPWAPATRRASSLVTSAKAKGTTVQEGDPAEGRIVETELRHEAERSYMAVRGWCGVGVGVVCRSLIGI